MRVSISVTWVLFGRPVLVVPTLDLTVISVGRSRVAGSQTIIPNNHYSRGQSTDRMQVIMLARLIIKRAKTKLRFNLSVVNRNPNVNDKRGTYMCQSVSKTIELIDYNNRNQRSS